MTFNLRQKPSGIWVVDFEEPGGGRRRVSTGTRDKAEAKQRARGIVLGGEAPAAQSDKPAPVKTGGATMRDLFNECLRSVWSPSRTKSQRTVLSNIRILEPLIGDELVTDVTASRLTDLRIALEKKGYKPATVKRKMDAVGRALTEAVDLKLIKERPKMPTVSVENLKDRILSPEEEVAVFAAIEKRIQAEPQRPWVRFKHLVTWLLHTGCRLSEPLQATPEWIIEHKGRPVLSIPGWAAKSGKGRPVPLTAPVVATIPYLTMTATNGKLFDMKPATAWYMWDTIREDVREAGEFNIDDVVLHTMRHTCLTRLLRSGMSLHMVSKWAGHANVLITEQRYVHTNAGDLLDSLDGLV